ncbi:MAG: coenzyme F420-reducing hydrogenase delta subunit [Desulforhopalus sp.]|jgi:coenzyme F420-reducing hydrogenase delta subunit
MTIKRMRFLQELLGFVGIDGRLHLEWISSAEAQKFADTITNFTEKIRGMGPSQFTRALTAPEVEAFLGKLEPEATVS